MDHHVLRVNFTAHSSQRGVPLEKCYKTGALFLSVQDFTVRGVLVTGNEHTLLKSYARLVLSFSENQSVEELTIGLRDFCARN